MDLKTDISWLKQHERLIIVVLSIVAVVYLARNIINHYYEVASQEVVNAAKTLENQQQLNQQHEQQFTQLEQQVSQLVGQLTAQNAQLQQNNQNAIKAAIQQQTADQQLSNQQLADRIALLTKQQNIQSTPEGVQLNHDQSISVTQQLDNGEAMAKQIANDNQIISNQSDEISGLINENNSCKIQVAGLNQQLVDQKTLSDAELKKAKISSWKSRLRWFAGGFISGYITGKAF